MGNLKLDVTLKRLMEEKNIKGVRQLSRDTGIPQATLSGFLNGGSFKKPGHILTLARFFSVSMEYLLFGEDKREPTLAEIATEELFEGWLHITVNKAIKGKRR